MLFPACIIKSQRVSNFQILCLSFECTTGTGTWWTCLHASIVISGKNRAPLKQHTTHAGLCNLHDVTSAFGIIWIIYPYKATIDYTRPVFWIIHAAIFHSLWGLLLWWEGLKVKGRGLCRYTLEQHFLCIVVGVAALWIYSIYIYICF